MFWFKSFRKFFRKIAIFRNFDHWSEILSMSAGRPLGQVVCPSLITGHSVNVCFLCVPLHAVLELRKGDRVAGTQ
jgi:hypothetical protein